jgi:ABC-type glycerol-3-phosphate transport system permease component
VRRILRLTVGQALLIGWTVVGVGPFVLSVLLALRSGSLLEYTDPVGVGGPYHPDNFRQAWDGPVGSEGMATFMVNSLTVAAVTLAVAVVVGTLAAYFVSHLGERVHAIVLWVCLACNVVPFVLLMIPFYRIYDALGLLNSPVALGFGYGALALPTTILVMQAYFADFPQELAEAAAIDGSGEFRTFFRIVLPLSKAAVVAVALLTLVFVWGEAQLGAVVLQDPAAKTVSVGALGFAGQWGTGLGPVFAALSIATVPLVVIYLIFNRFISKGIALGGAFK